MALDREHLASMTGGDAEFEAEILCIFLAQAEIYINDMASAASAEAWRRTAHTLKGSASSIGGRQLAACAFDLEKGDWPQGGHRIAALDRLRAELDAIRQQYPFEKK